VIGWVLLECTQLPTALQAVLVFVCRLWVPVLLEETLSTYAGWPPDNLKYTPRIQSTIEYMKTVPRYEREAIELIELISCLVVAYLGLGEPCLPAGWKQWDTNRAVSVFGDSWSGDNHWRSVRLAIVVTVLMTLASAPFFLFAFYMSARKMDR